jgi:hypothetical protein
VARFVLRHHFERHCALTQVEEAPVSSARQRAAARRNIKKAATAAKSKKTIAHLSRETRTALGKQGAKTAKRAKRSRR